MRILALWKQRPTAYLSGQESLVCLAIYMLFSVVLAELLPKDIANIVLFATAAMLTYLIFDILLIRIFALWFLVGFACVSFFPSSASTAFMLFPVSALLGILSYFVVKNRTYYAQKLRYVDPRYKRAAFTSTAHRFPTLVRRICACFWMGGFVILLCIILQSAEECEQAHTCQKVLFGLGWPEVCMLFYIPLSYPLVLYARGPYRTDI